MNFFHSIYQTKLGLMRAAAPRATLRMLHECDGFSLFLDEAAAARKLTQIGVLRDKGGDDILDEPVLHLFVPFDQVQRFCEAVAAAHTVAFIDVSLPTKQDKARFVAYACIPKKSKGDVAELQNRLAKHDGCSRWGAEDMIALRGMYDRPEVPDPLGYPQPKQTKSAEKTKIMAGDVPEFLEPVAALPEKLAEKDEDADFWS